MGLDSRNLEQFLAAKRREWTAALLSRHPQLGQPLSQALRLLSNRAVTKTAESHYKVRGNPHDYWVNLPGRSCSCGKPTCEHFLAAWFASSEEEIIQEAQAMPSNHADEHAEHGRWLGPTAHICADGYYETSVYGIGENAECVRCRAPYCAICDETR